MNTFFDFIQKDPNINSSFKNVFSGISINKENCKNGKDNKVPETKRKTDRR